MKKLINDPFYSLIDEYKECVIDYYILKGDNYKGLSSHKEAMQFAMELENLKIFKIIEEYNMKYGKECKLNTWTFDIEKASLESISEKELFFVPEIVEKDKFNTSLYYDENNNDGGVIPYWYAFLEYPYSSGDYNAEDFKKVNKALFPNGFNNLEIYQWSTDWSNYFDAGREWWGASCWSIYDKSLDRYIVILASSTD